MQPLHKLANPFRSRNKTTSAYNKAMAAPPGGPQGDSLTAELQQTLNDQERIFAVHLASGCTQGESATFAGWESEYGREVATRPRVRSFVLKLLESQKTEDLSSIASRAWVETQLIIIIKAALYGSPSVTMPDGRTLPELPRNHVHAAKVIMDLARIKGMVVERKLAMNTNANLGSVSRQDVMGSVGKLLDALEPGQRAKIQRLLDAPVTGDLADADEVLEIEPAPDTPTGSGKSRKR